MRETKYCTTCKHYQHGEKKKVQDAKDWCLGSYFNAKGEPTPVVCYAARADENACGASAKNWEQA